MASSSAWTAGWIGAASFSSHSSWWSDWEGG
jgi:hypothetical protein